MGKAIIWNKSKDGGLIGSGDFGENSVTYQIIQAESSAPNEPYFNITKKLQ